MDKSSENVTVKYFHKHVKGFYITTKEYKMSEKFAFLTEDIFRTLNSEI